MIRGMNPAGPRVDLPRQLVRVSGLELGQRPVLENERGQLVVLGQLRQHILGGRWLPFRRLAEHRQLELVEQNLLQLLR